LIAKSKNGKILFVHFAFPCHNSVQYFIFADICFVAAVVERYRIRCVADDDASIFLLIVACDLPALSINFHFDTICSHISAMMITFG
jgi:hypothetical protein